MELLFPVGLRSHLALLIGRLDFGEMLFSFLGNIVVTQISNLAGRVGWVGLCVDLTRFLIVFMYNFGVIL